MSKGQVWIAGWIDIACGLVAVVTLGRCRPGWDMQFAAWCVLANARFQPPNVRGKPPYSVGLGE